MGSSIKDKVVIVTGGGQGIGRAYVLALAEEGARVVVAEINGSNAEAVASEARDRGGVALAVPTDVSDFQSVQSMARDTISTYGRIDVLVNNAAIYYGLRMKSFLTLEESEWDRVMSVNVKGTWNCSRAVLPEMLKQGRGKIINVASAAAIAGTPMLLHYTASKGAVLSMTKSMAREVALLGDAEISVNAILPGLTWTEASEGIFKDNQNIGEANLQRQAIKRNQQADDLVGPLLFLVSDDSNFMTGHSLVVDGGYTLW